MDTQTLILNIINHASSLETVSLFAAAVIGYVGVIIIAYGAIKSAIHFIISTLRNNNHLPYIRIDLGKHLVLGLEFLVGKDIIESIIQPSWDDLGKLAVVIALRTFTTLVLSWELKQIKEELRQKKVKQ